MGNGHSAVVARGLRTLWVSGSVGGMTDGQLIARFVERRDESGEVAFEALVGRHGPMVLRVARDVLRDPHSAEDAFQATFLVLARKAGSIARPETLGPWLYGVASRVARKARVEADRRRRHERRAAERASRGLEPEAGRGDLGLGPTLHDEVARLPGPCRVAVVLCYFEGLTYDQAARRLGVTEATVRGRLARARRVLRGRLAPRGAAAWSLPVVPGRWIGPTARAATRFARGGKEAASAPVAGLAEGVLKAMFLSKLKAAAVLLAFHLAAVAAVLARPQQPAVDGPEPSAVRREADPRLEVPEMIRRPEEPIKPAHLALTLDQAVARLFREDDDLRTKFAEIPQARADIITAPLRANPEFYADAQLVPYGGYTGVRPGGRTQYDANVSYPVDLTRKRRARAASAARVTLPTNVPEAQYQDAARLRIDGLASAFGEALTARDLDKIRREGVERLDRLAEVAQEKGKGPDEFRRIEEARKVASEGRSRSLANLERALLALARSLKLPEGEAAGLEVVGELGRASAFPSTETLTTDALSIRPDLVACRLGVERAKDGVTAAGRLDPPDLYQFFQPDNFTNPFPIAPSLPAYRRAKLNVAQTLVQLADLERRVASDVRDARVESEDSRQAIPEAKEQALATRYALETAWARYSRGTHDLAGVLAASGRADEAARLKVEAMARHYRGRMALNTAVGRRVVQP